MIDGYPIIQLEVIVNTESDEDENTTPPPPTEKEKATETPNDPPKTEPEPEPEPQPDNGLSERLETLEKEVSAMKAMMDTLGFDRADRNGSDNDKTEPEDSTITIEDLF